MSLKQVKALIVKMDTYRDLLTFCALNFYKDPREGSSVLPVNIKRVVLGVWEYL